MATPAPPNSRCFLDYNATRQSYPEIWDFLRPFAREPLNVSSVHGLGQLARHELRQLSKELADLLQVHPLDLVYTSGATEANNLAILGALKKDLPARSPRSVYVSPTSHPSIANLQNELQSLGFRVEFLRPVSVENPLIDCEAAARQFESEPPLLIALEWVNNEFGGIQPVSEIYELASQYGAFLHVDAVQAFGRIETPLHCFPKASFAFSGHKYGGIGGHGLLVKPHNLHLQAQIIGGHQQNGLRAGSLSLVMVASQVYCMKRYLAERPRRYEHCLDLRKQLEAFLDSVFEERHAGHILGAQVDRVPNTTMFRLAGVHAESVSLFADLNQVMISTGSACASGSVDPSSGLLRLGLSGSEAAEYVRVSTSEDSSAEDIRVLSSVLDAFLADLHCRGR
jgi:cysteine desulfurase